MSTSSLAQCGGKGLILPRSLPTSPSKHSPLLAQDWPDGVSRWQQKAPLGRLGLPFDVADAVLFLLSPAARWISGTLVALPFDPSENDSPATAAHFTENQVRVRFLLLVIAMEHLAKSTTKNPSPQLAKINMCYAYSEPIQNIGNQGAKGQQGAKGPAGPQGAKGPAGPQGNQGPQGNVPLLATCWQYEAYSEHILLFFD